MAALDLGNVMGPQGPQGEQGEIGPQGPQGPQGEPGPPVDTSTLIQQSEKGAANGVASLDGNGKLAQMPTAADVGALSVDAISSGNNTNGSWVKFPDGTMVCYGSKSLLDVIPSQSTTDFTIPLPQTFIAAPQPQVSIFHDTGVNYTVRARAATTTQIKIGVYNPSQYESTGTVVSWFVIGKWK